MNHGGDSAWNGLQTPRYDVPTIGLALEHNLGRKVDRISGEDAFIIDDCYVELELIQSSVDTHVLVKHRNGGTIASATIQCPQLDMTKNAERIAVTVIKLVEAVVAVI